MEKDHLRIALVNMPFCYLESPSLGLAQIKSVLLEEPGLTGRIEVGTHYLQHDFARKFGIDVYQQIADSESALLGEWLFSDILFPGRLGTSDEYVNRYFPALKHEIMFLKSNIEGFLDDAITQHELERANVVGLTSLYQQTAPSLALAKRLRCYPGERTIVMGGGNCEGTMGKALIRNFDFLDFVCSGSGLVSFPQFISHILAGDDDACHSISGLFSGKNECPVTWDTQASASVIPLGALLKRDRVSSAVPVVGLHGVERDINDVVEVDYSEFLDSFERKIRPIASGMHPRLVIETSRGCWWGEKSHCTFCGSCGWDISYKSISPARAIEYINSTVARHQHRASYFECVDQLIPKNFPEEVMPHLRLGEKNGLFYEVRTTMSEEDMQRLAVAGVRAIQPGVEALSSPLLKLMAKGVSASHNLAHLKRCVKHGLTPMWALLVGLPDEPEDYYAIYRRMIPLLVHLPPPMAVSPVGFHRNSPYTWYPEKYNLNLKPASVYQFIYDLPEKEIRDLAYFFEDATLDPAYRRNAKKYLESLAMMVKIWRRAWVGSENALPQLCFVEKEGSNFVYDTRTGREVWHALDAVHLDILQRMGEPCALIVLNESPFDAEQRDRAVATLIEKGLLFVEESRGVSLVLKEEGKVPPFVKMLREGKVVLH